jgi:hypothetical protein
VKGFYLVMYLRNLSMPVAGNCDVCTQVVLFKGSIFRYERREVVEKSQFVVYTEYYKDKKTRML